MREFVARFGENAGRIWSALSSGGVLSKDDILGVAGLSESDFYSGLGWLGREGKVVVDGDFFSLGFCDLSLVFGVFAGRVWRVLDIWGDADFVTIRRLSGLSDGDVFVALGWLAREGKVDVVEGCRFVLR